MDFSDNVLFTSRFIMEHFTEIATKSNELLMLSDEAMVEIISSDDLNVKNEEIVFECIIRWINHDLENRKLHIAKLLRCIRLGLLSTQYFVETVKVKFIRHVDSTFLKRWCL
jgi:kelch-like protein 10